LAAQPEHGRYSVCPTGRGACRAGRDPSCHTPRLYCRMWLPPGRPAGGRSGVQEGVPMTTRDRYLGCLLGLAVGDAVGRTIEFKPRGSFTPITDMLGGGPFRLRPGQWTDDTSRG
jgi:hypothetical protein